MSVTYTLLGYGTTDENGIAHMTHDANGDELATPGYKGVGAGKLDIVAGNSNPVSGGTLLSETYSLFDAIFYDSGITGTPNTAWFNLNDAVSVTPSDTGITLSKTTTGNGYYIANQTSSTQYPFQTPICIEFDLIEASGSPRIAFAGISGYYVLTTESHVKIEFKSDGKRYANVNGVEQTPVNFTDEDLSVRFQLGQNSSLKFKDFRIYSI